VNGQFKKSNCVSHTMTHRLRQRNTHNPVANPLVASLRYRCECANNEVLQVQVVFDMDTSEEQFMWTMQMLWRDVKTEVAQHLNQGEVK
jgi:hypothetical protein